MNGRVNGATLSGVSGPYTPQASTSGKPPGEGQRVLQRLELMLQMAEQIDQRLRRAMDVVTGPTPECDSAFPNLPPPSGLIGGMNVGIEMLDRCLSGINESVARLETVVG